MSFEIRLRTKNTKNILASRRAVHMIDAEAVRDELRKEMSRWEKNTTRFDNDPLEVVILEEY